ncbi:MAG: hypothetical protein WC933_01610 [Candidatus Paceibacterota bacterium]|jgi:hypothetical protein
MINKAGRQLFVMKGPRRKKKSSFVINELDIKCLKKYFQDKNELEKHLKKSPPISFSASVGQLSA